MTLKEFLETVKDFPPDALLCVAELDEAFAMNVASIDLVEDGVARSREADGGEAVQLGGGKEKVVVVRW